MRVLQWLSQRDRGLAALRRSARAAIVMPAMFALGDKVIANAQVATFAAFGSFALLLLVDFSGPMRDRLQAQAALSVAGAVLVCLGTLASRSAWVAAVSMAVVGFGVLFAGVVSSVLASATTSLLLAFILPVCLPGPVSSIPDRLAGWGLAALAAFGAVAFLWPAPARDPLRGPATVASRALAARLRSEVARIVGGPEAPTDAEHDAVLEQANAAMGALQRSFLASPYRPTGLGTPARSVVRLVDELSWLNSIMNQSVVRPVHVDTTVCAVKLSSATVLECGADLLDDTSASPEALDSAMAGLRAALTEMERHATVELPVRRLVTTSDAGGSDERMNEFITSLDPSFRSQELSFAVSQIAGNIELAAAADKRSWLNRVLGHQPAGIAGTVSAARERAAAHVQWHSVWLHNSVRGAVALGLAVLVADLADVQHAFWVVLGTLSVLRSNALSTGQNTVRGLVGTVVGFVIGAALLVPIGNHLTLLWFLLPIAILFAGVAPAAISFAAGQAAFTVTLVVLFNIIQPAGWHVGLLRLEDVAIGCAVSLAVGLLFWPRGAAAALGLALAEAYTASIRYLASAVDFGIACCDGGPGRTAVPQPPTEAAVRAAAASPRLDDTFRGFLAERGAKPVQLADVTALVTGPSGVRLAGDAVLDLWRPDNGNPAGDRRAAQGELLASTELLVQWYDGLAASLGGRSPVPEPLPHDKIADGRLIDALRRDLSSDGQASSTAVRMIGTGDHLDAVRRLQDILAAPARTASRRRAFDPPTFEPLDEMVPALARGSRRPVSAD
jgi:uncharacterized membrane protein YccC